MRRLRILARRLSSLFRRARADDDLRREIDLHVEMLVRERIAEGATEADARRAARLAFGSPDRISEECRDRRRVTLVDDFLRDLRHGLRMLARSPGFAATAVVSLALGIGANLGIFSLVDALLLRTLQVERPHELVFLKIGGSERIGGAPPYPCLDRIRQRAPSFNGLAAFTADELRVEVEGELEQVFAQVASDNYFTTLGLRPARGRLLAPGDERLDPPAAVIGHAYWRRRFGGDPTAVGRVIRVEETAYTIVGITPEGFNGLEPGRRVDLTLPITHARGMMSDTGAWWLEAVGRLRRGVAPGEAAAQADAVFQTFMAEWPGSADSRRRDFRQVVLEPAAQGLDGLRTRFRPPLTVLGVIGAMVLLLACANLGSLLIARGEARAREMAIRIATGAGGGRLVRQLLTETLLVVMLGGAAGLIVAHLALQHLLVLFSLGRRPIYVELHYDWRLAVFALAVTLVTAVLTGLWPAMRATTTDPHQAMKEGEGRVTGPPRGTVATRVLVAVQVAVSLVLLTAALLFGRTMSNLRDVDLGFRRGQVLTMSIDLVLPGNAAAAARPVFHRRVLERVRALPGVDAASLSVLTPLSGRDTGRSVAVAGFEPQSDDERVARLNHVSEDYFRTFGIALVAGRGFTPGDWSATRKPAVLNAAAARRYFPARSPVGETIALGGTASYEIVGVVADHKHRTLREKTARMVFVPMAQPVYPLGRVTLGVASARTPAELARIVAAEVRAAHPRALVSDVVGIEEQIDVTLLTERLLSQIASAFAGLALMLASVGLYGTLSYLVARRRPEIGIRMALGARPVRVASGVVRQALAPLAAGLLLGLPLALLVARSAAGLLFGVTPLDAASYAGAAAVLSLVVLAASWAPAHRAASVDPLEAIRTS